MTTQYDISTNQYIERNNNLFDVVMQADENGELWNSRYGKDAWGRHKSVIDHSIFNATWTQAVPSRVWEQQSINYSSAPIEVNTPQSTFTHVSSIEHMLVVKSGTVANSGYSCRSKRHPKYQANRGHLYSTAITTDTPTANALRRWGLGTDKEGIYFDLRGDGTTWDMFVVRKLSNSIVNEVSIKSILPSDFDASKSHIYDIQFQWRGAGNYYFFVDLKLVHTFSLLGTLTELSLHDPALPIDFRSICLQNGTEVTIKSGCVDVSSEGGERNDKGLFASVNTGSTLLTTGAGGTDTAVIALRVPRTVTYDGAVHYNSRGINIDKIVTWCRDEALTSVYIFRDTYAPNLNGLTWNSTPDSMIQFLNGGTASLLNNAYLIDEAGISAVLREWADLEVKNIITNESQRADLTLTPGDIAVFVVAPIGANKGVAATVYYSEEI